MAGACATATALALTAPPGAANVAARLWRTPAYAIPERESLAGMRVAYRWVADNP